MKKTDIDRFIKAYSNDSEDAKRGPFTHALGIDFKSIIGLHELIFEDLDTQNYGVGWWKSYEPSLDWKRRVLISDQLFKCVSSIEDNLIELHLHFLETQDYWEKYSLAMSDSISYIPSEGLVPNFPPPNALDDINLNLRNTHIAGFFRAVGSVADCVAGAIIGVMGLSQNIKKADLDSVRRYLRKNEMSLLPPQREFASKLEDLIKIAGPGGWLSWAMQYRNMLVHRARRVQIDSQKAYSLPGLTGQPLLNSLNVPIIKTETTPHLAVNPDLSDIESLVQNDLKLLLDESAETTMKGILGSLQIFIDSCLLELTEVWKKRKSDPTLIAQPAAQWQEAPARATEQFAGYSPNSTLSKVEKMHSSPQMIRRMRSASLDGDNIKKWSE